MEAAQLSRGRAAALVVLALVAFLLLPSLVIASPVAGDPSLWTTPTHAATYDVNVSDHHDAHVLSEMHDDAGRVLFDATVSVPGTLVLTDGTTADGTARQVDTGLLVAGRHQVSVTLQGDRYAFTLDQARTFSLRTLVPATAGTLHVDPVGVRYANLRDQALAGSTDTIFGLPLATSGWSTYATGAANVTQNETTWGFVGHGLLEVHGSAGIGDVGFASFPLDAHGGRYVVHAMAAPRSTGIGARPDQIAVLAGLTGITGSGTVLWAVTIGPSGPRASLLPIEGWALYVVTPGRSPVRISANYTGSDPREVVAWVDEAAGTLTVQVDHGEAVTTTGLSLNDTARIAAGDVWTAGNAAGVCPVEEPDLVGHPVPCFGEPTGKGTLLEDDVFEAGWNDVAWGGP